MREEEVYTGGGVGFRPWDGDLANRINGFADYSRHSANLKASPEQDTHGA
jgi:hypothetical protein